MTEQTQFVELLGTILWIILIAWRCAMLTWWIDNIYNFEYMLKSLKKNSQQEIKQETF
jgi:hypothetical protein